MVSVLKEKAFIRLLFSKTSFTVFTVLGIGLLYIVFMSVIDHKWFPFPYIILGLAFFKTIVISTMTLKQLTKMVNICHSFEDLLWIFGLLIMVSLLSFATDYTCLYQFDNQSFEGIPAYSDTYVYNLFHFFYFSVITFSTIGYGDIIPTSDVSRFIVLLETFLSFFIIVFALANVKKIHINK